MKQTAKDSSSVLGLGAAACVACCVGPILAFLGGLGIAGLASTLLLGTAGLAIAGGATVAFLVVRRRRTSCGVAADGPVPAGLTARSPAPTTHEVP